MLIHELKIAGLLSFGPEGVTVPLRNLNVLIGANGSGKSNFLEVLALLKAVPRTLAEAIKEAGGIRDWLWKGPGNGGVATIEVIVSNEPAKKDLWHILRISQERDWFDVVEEYIKHVSVSGSTRHEEFYYRFQNGHAVLRNPDGTPEPRPLQSLSRTESIISQVIDNVRYPELAFLNEAYSRIRLFRNWSFGPSARLRYDQSVHGTNDFPSDVVDNLAIMISALSKEGKDELVRALAELYDGIVDVSIEIGTGRPQIILEEKGGRRIPSTRLSDGTLRYLCLLAILLHPTPPPLIAIEEPEMGLHPDVLPNLVKLMRQASERTQLVVTTHSEIIVDALSDEPDAVIVCEKVDGRSQFERLDAERLKHWLDRYSLGQLWTKGGIGGNRW